VIFAIESEIDSLALDTAKQPWITGHESPRNQLQGTAVFGKQWIVVLNQSSIRPGI
jgi:hypothetical protein